MSDKKSCDFFIEIDKKVPSNNSGKVSAKYISDDISKKAMLKDFSSAIRDVPRGECKHDIIDLELCITGKNASVDLKSSSSKKIILDSRCDKGGSYVDFIGHKEEIADSIGDMNIEWHSSFDVTSRESDGKIINHCIINPDSYINIEWRLNSCADDCGFGL